MSDRETGRGERASQANSASAYYDMLKKNLVACWRVVSFEVCAFDAVSYETPPCCTHGAHAPYRFRDAHGLFHTTGSEEQVLLGDWRSAWQVRYARCRAHTSVSSCKPASAHSRTAVNCVLLPFGASRSNFIMWRRPDPCTQTPSMSAHHTTPHHTTPRRAAAHATHLARQRTASLGSLDGAQRCLRTSLHHLRRRGVEAPETFLEHRVAG